METRKPFQKLDLFDRFLFDEVMKDDGACQAMFELVLGENLGKFHHTESEKEFRKSPLYRAVRMDIFARNEQDTVFNAEMQNKNTGSLPKRSRFYQAHLDVSLLKPGIRNFNSLNDTFIVLIAPFDLFGQNRYCYTFRMRADEDTSLCLNDGITRIFLNTEGKNDSEVSPDLLAFLQYLKVSGRQDMPDTDNGRILKIHKQVLTVRANEQVEVRYMQAWEELEYAKDDAREEGRAEGLAEGLSEGLAKANDANMNFIQYLLQQNKPDLEIREIVGCEQELIDRVRNENTVE